MVVAEEKDIATAEGSVETATVVLAAATTAVVEAVTNTATLL